MNKATTNEIIPAATSPAATAISTTKTDIPSILALAVQQGVDPASLEKLMDLHERYQAKQAERAFNDALADFQSRCPIVAHNKTNSHINSTYANYAQVMKTIGALLAECGLSVKHDSTADVNTITVTCYIHHRDGHYGTSTMTLPIAEGTKATSGPQKYAMTLTYAKRYTLLMALGVATAEEDTDGSVPEKQPKRGMDIGNPDAVSKADLAAIYDEWCQSVLAKDVPPTDRVSQFRAWVAGVTGLSAVDTGKASNWKPEFITSCRTALKPTEQPKAKSGALFDDQEPSGPYPDGGW